MEGDHHHPIAVLLNNKPHHRRMPSVDVTRRLFESSWRRIGRKALVRPTQCAWRSKLCWRW
jgi:anti-sigma factor ChrR (cupin superfamily)